MATSFPVVQERLSQSPFLSSRRTFRLAKDRREPRTGLELNLCSAKQDFLVLLCGAQAFAAA